MKLRTPPPIPRRPIDGHKGTFGRVLVVGGSGAMLGAPVLAGTAALRMGAGLVQIGVEAPLLMPALTITPELIGLALKTGKSSLKELVAAAQKADALVVGPGMGQSAAARARLAALIRIKKPAVFDADALNMLAAGGRWPGAFAADAVLTPHPGEMKRLIPMIARSSVPTDDAGRIALAQAFSRYCGQVIVLKGHRTVVADGKQVYVNHTGDSSLSKGGTGDVLSGIIGALLGQKMTPFAAACAGVNLHGHAGAAAGKRLGRRSVLARDVIDALPALLRRMP